MGWRWLVVMCLVLSACGALRKPPEPDRRLNVQTAGTVFDSDRGYRFAALPDPTARVVRLDIRYPVGSADDPPGKAGLAHLVEHLLYEVEYTVGETKTSISAELGRLALSWNAYTHEDYTSHEVLAGPEALDAIIKLEVNRLAIGCGGLTAAIMAREREVVINELRQRQGAGGADLQRAIFDAVYPVGHPYRAVDSIDSVAKLELKDVCDFLAGPYQRGHAIVVASGAIDGPALQKAAGNFARARKRTQATRPVPPVVQPTGGTVRLKVDVEEPRLLVTWPLPPMATREYRLLQIPSQFIASRIEAFGFTYGWGHSATMSMIGGAHAPVLVVSITLTSTSKLDDAIDATGKAVEYALRVVYRGGDTRESPGWIRLWQGRAESLLARWESLGGRNHMFADFLQLEPTSTFLVGRIDELAKAGPKETQDLGELWLSPGRARFLLLEPSEAGGASTARGYGGGAESHGARVDAALADRAMPLPPANLGLALERYKLDNGLTVIAWPHGTAPLVHGRLVIDSGSAHDPIGKEGVSMLVGADELYADSMVFTGRELSTRIDDLVEALALELRSPGYELDDDEKKHLRGRLVMKRAKERSSYTHDVRVAVYGKGHPYARPSMTEDSLEKIDRDLVMGWARGHLVARNATLIIAGKLDPALLKRHIEYNADQVGAGTDSRDLDAIAQPRKQWIRGLTTKHSPTVELEVSFLGGRGLGVEHAKRLVLEQVLASQLTALRGKQAVSYGFSASYTPRRAGGLWAISGEVDASRAGEAATTVATILAEMRHDPESYRSAFVLARQKVVEALLLTATDSSAITERLVEVARFDLADDFYQRLVAEVARLTLSDFHPFVASELALEHQVFGAFGNDEAVAAAILAAQRVKAPASTKLTDPFAE